MKIIQILVLIGIVLYIIFSCINFMEQYSEKAKLNFREERNWKITITIIVFMLLYSCGTFNQIL